MREEDQTRPEVQGFDCGAEEYALPVATFLASGQAWEHQRSGESQTWVVEENDYIVGYANLFRASLSYPKWNGKEKIPALGIAWLGVAKEQQQRGIATFILESIIVAANSDLSLSRVYLLVDIRNPAIALYRRLGFVEHPTRPYSLQDGTTHLRMTLALIR
jgi:ribosomal protein S18 acetylase RimI-like enzyme